MNDIVNHIGRFIDKIINVQVKGEDEYTLYTLNNAFPDGTLELITREADDENGRVYYEYINLRDVLRIAIEKEDVDESDN